MSPTTPPTLDWLADDAPEDAIGLRTGELLDRAERNAWAVLLGTEQGRLIAWTILDKCHVFSTTYTGNAASNFLEGERSVGLKVLKEHILPIGPQVLADMMTEAEDRYSMFEAQAEAEIDALTKRENDND